jgi:hypothetical protein
VLSVNICSRLNRRELFRSLAAGTVTLFVVPAALTLCEDDLPDPDDINNPDNNVLTIDLNSDKYSVLGPADSPLKKYEVTQEEDILSIAL